MNVKGKSVLAPRPSKLVTVVDNKCEKHDSLKEHEHE